MAGHSKWANIKHRKGKADLKRGKVFSRIAKEIISATKLGGPDPRGNPRLRLAVQKAKEANVPNEIVERNIKKASSEDQADFTEMTYELYGHGGVGIICDVMTDNKNRVSSDFRIATNKRGGAVANPGSVLFNFDKKGIIEIPKEDYSEDELFLAATEAGAEDFEAGDDLFLVTTEPSQLFNVKEGLTKLNYKINDSYLEMLPKTYVESDVETAKLNLALIDWLEQLDDVDAVYHNMQIPEGAL